MALKISKNNMEEIDTKLRIIEEGAKLIHLKGFNNTGLQEILSAADVPKGSFYFYFKSKEDFGLQLLEHYSPFFKKTLEKFLTLNDLSEVEKLKKCFIEYRKFFEKAHCRKGCPIGNLSLEMSDQNELFRKKLKIIYNEMKKPIEEALKIAQSNEEVPNSFDPEEMSSFIINSWEGALVEMKLTRSSQSLKIFENMVFDLLLHC